MKNIIYLGNFYFPHGNAAGNRVYGNGKALKKSGINTIYIGTDESLSFDDFNPIPKRYEDFEYYSLPYPSGIKDWVSYKKQFRNFLEIFNKIECEIESIICYGSPSNSLFLFELIKFCNNNNIKLIADVVDWLTIKTKNPIFNIAKWIDTELQKNVFNKKVDGMITISHYLSEFYKKVKPNIVIPPLVVNEKKNLELDRDYFLSRKQIVFTYAGKPFRLGEEVTDFENLKDRIDLILEHLLFLSNAGVKFEFTIFGFTKKDYLIAFPHHKYLVQSLKSQIKFEGVVDNKIVRQKIHLSDFTILFRNNNRNSNAGFPTKIAESISLGTPVIANLTSDIDKYLEDQKHIIIVDDINDDKSLYEISNLTREQIYKMKLNCLELQPFNYQKYSRKLHHFFMEVL